MRRIVLLSFLSLDGVMQAPGGPEEDTSDGFGFGGWTAPFFGDADAAAGELMARQMRSSDLLLGRRTYDIFAGYWPQHAESWPGIDDVTKYVVSRTLTDPDWRNTSVLGDLDAVEELRRSGEGDLQVHGSGELAQGLLERDLVDELWLKTFPVTIGTGRRLFGDGTRAAAFTLTESLVTPSGVVFANYTRAGDLRTGTVGE